MINAGCKCKFGGLEGVISREVDVQEENPSLKWRVSGAQDGCLKSAQNYKLTQNDVSKADLPVKWIISYWAC